MIHKLLDADPICVVVERDEGVANEERLEMHEVGTHTFGIVKRVDEEECPAPQYLTTPEFKFFVSN